jgi:hypothetical protein
MFRDMTIVSIHVYPPEETVDCWFLAARRGQPAAPQMGMRGLFMAKIISLEKFNPI